MALFKPDDGCPLFYEVWGENAGGRPAIVFLNGTAQTTLNWRPFANRLKTGAQVVLYDARSQGRSGGDCGIPDINRHVTDLEQLLDHLALERIGLVGLSHGARVALAAGRYLPSRIDRLMLLSLELHNGMRAALTVNGWRRILAECGLEALMRAMLPVVFSEAFLRQEARVLDKIVEALVQRNDAQKINQLLTAIASYPPVAAILPEPAPLARVLAGADDPLISTKGAQALAQRLNGSFRLLNKTGHSIPAEAPERLYAEITSFFRLNPRPN
jgi:pimeloyl-ACP methyl ester carboxylesterase